MPPSSKPIKNARLELRLTLEMKELLQEAASLSGLAMGAFALSAAAEKAQSLLSQHQHRILSERDGLILLEILENEEPNAALLSAAQRYKSYFPNEAVSPKAAASWPDQDE